MVSEKSLELCPKRNFKGKQLEEGEGGEGEAADKGAVWPPEMAVHEGVGVAVCEDLPAVCLWVSRSRQASRLSQALLECCVWSADSWRSWLHWAGYRG